MNQQEIMAVRPVELPEWAKDKKRGGYLTSWLLGTSLWVITFKMAAFLELVRIHSVMSNARLYENVLPSVSLNVAINCVLIASTVVGLVGMWGWRKWGAYLVAGALVIDLVAKIIFGEPISRFVPLLVVLVPMYVAVAPRWHLFK